MVFSQFCHLVYDKPSSSGLVSQNNTSLIIPNLDIYSSELKVVVLFQITQSTNNAKEKAVIPDLIVETYSNVGIVDREKISASFMAEISNSGTKTLKILTSGSYICSNNVAALKVNIGEIQKD